MRAQNLTICIPNRGCNKNCPYCVSKMTFSPERPKKHSLLMSENVAKVITFAKAANVNSVLLTGKGEPLLNRDSVSFFLKSFSEFPTEIQTNGLCIVEEGQKFIKRLCVDRLNIISISVDDIDFLKKIPTEIISDYGMICRVTINVTKKLFGNVEPSFDELFNRCVESGIQQLTLRNVVVPNNISEHNSVSRWIIKNCDPKIYQNLRDEMIKKCEISGRLIRKLNYGSVVYDIEGISVSYSDYCIQDDNSGDDIRSLIFHEDGHLYTSWSSKASILF